MLQALQSVTILAILLLSCLQTTAHPLALNRHQSHEHTETTTAPLDTRDSQITLAVSSNSTQAPKRLHTLQDLYAGNTNFRQNARQQAVLLAEEGAQRLHLRILSALLNSQDRSAPSFMFLGCADNRMSPSAIFNAPVGSIMSHNNIGNQYSSRDLSADAAIAYAIEEAHVQHIILLGHYGCKGVEAAITQSSKTSRLVQQWVKPIVALYRRTRRREIVILRDSRMPRRDLPNGITTAPPASDAGFRALVEENVKKSVKELRRNSILTKAYSRRNKQGTEPIIDVFVHGFVYDEVTGEVHDLHVSFGPPGKAIPTIPFTAVAAAKNFHRDSSRPGINKGKTWDFGAHASH